MTLAPPAPDTEALKEFSDAPRLAPGVELVGAYDGAGHAEQTYLIGRPDGRMVQVSLLLFRLAAALDGHRGPAELAARVGAELGRDLDADRVDTLLRERLAPAGVLDGDAPGEAEPVALHDHLLMLRLRLPVVPATVAARIGATFRSMHRPAVVVVLLAAFVAVDVAVVGVGGPGALVPGLLAIVGAPALALAVLGLVLVSGAFHECGHVSACTYGGARPGAMGVGVYLVWPAFYSTVTDSYRLARRGRLRTDLGGVYFNAVFVTGVGVVYLLTGTPWLLVAIAALHLETVRQFIPTIRFDGYYILSDLIGVADLFAYLGPVLTSALPGRPTDPRVARLRPAARRTVVVWVLGLVPVLLFFVVVLAMVAPHILPALAQRVNDHLAAAAVGVRAGDAALFTYAVVQGLFALLPFVAGPWIAALVLRRLATPLLGARRAPEGLAGPLLLALVTTAALGLLAWAGAGMRLATATEAGLAARVEGAGTPAAAQIAALEALLGVRDGDVTDGARAATLVLGAITALLVWPAVRRIGLSAVTAATAVLLAGFGALLGTLPGTIDGAAVASAWLALAAGLAGRGRGPTAVAVTACLVAAVTSPLAGAAVLAFTVHSLRTGQLGGGLPRRGVRTIAVLAAAGAAALVLVDPAPGGAPPSLAQGVLLTAGAAAVAGIWAFGAPLRPLATGAALLLAVAAVPTGRTAAALLLAVPALAVCVAALLAAPRQRSRWGLAAVLALGCAGLGPAVTAAATLPPDRAALSRWVLAEIDPGTPIAASPLVAAQLARDGVPVARFVAAGTAGAVVLGAPGPGTVLAAFPAGPGGGPVVARAGAARPTADGRIATRRVAPPVPAATDVGGQLAGNPALRLAPAVTDLMRAGAVDPRLAMVLTGLTAAHRLTVAELPAVPGEPASAPRRTAVVTAVDGAAASVPGTTDIVRRWLEGQQPPYRPRVTVTPDGLVVHYPVPTS